MTEKKILIINGHPDKESFIYGLSEAYIAGANSSGANIKEIRIRDLEFNPNLQFVGIKKVNITAIGPIRLSKEDFRKKWLRRIEKLGKENK